MSPWGGTAKPRRVLDGRRSSLARTGSGRVRRQRRISIARLAMGMACIMLALHLLGPSIVPHFLLPSPSPAARSAALARLLSLSGDVDPAGSGEGGAAAAVDATPKLIPRIVHQTYKNAQVPPSARRLMLTWRTMNPGWDVRFYDDQACLDFVRKEFPEYLAAYKALERDVQRSDFFRYMVVLRLGGVYADIDTEVRQPLDSLLLSSDTMVVGWENEFVDAQATVDAWYVRPRQVLQWVFAAAPGHPALREVCERIARSVGTRFSLSPAIDTLERTGPGVFTDVVLAAAAASPWAGAARNPWTVRILPRVAFGAPRAPAYGLSPRDPGVVVLHHFMGSWRSRRRWPWQVSAREALGAVSRRFLAHPGDAEAEEVAHVAAMPTSSPDALYPTSIAFSPPFVAMTQRGGLGDPQSGTDVAAALCAHGGWQPSVQPHRSPTLAEVLVGAMGGAAEGGGAAQRRGLLVDVGAGYGMVALAAAARGHSVHAFELAPRSRAGLEAAVRYNGFEPRVTLHDVALGAPSQRGDACLAASAGGAGAAPAPAEAAVELARGFAPALSPAAGAPGCARLAPRQTLEEALPRGVRVDALRISANGWEAHVLEGFAPLLAHAPPAVVAVEWNPAALRAAGTADPVASILRLLTDAGYTEASHSGYVCDERWYSATYGVRRRGGVAPEDLAALRQPTWCRLTPADWGLLLDRAPPRSPETLLFVNRGAGAAARRVRGADQGQTGGSLPAGVRRPLEEQGRQGSAGGAGRDADRLARAQRLDARGVALHEDPAAGQAAKAERADAAVHATAAAVATLTQEGVVGAA